MADPSKLMKLLELAEKFGVKRSRVIGTQGNVVPLKKPSLVNVTVDEFKLKNSIDEGTITMDKVKQEMEETVKLALSKNLNDVELDRVLNNAINIDRQFFPPMAEVVEAGSKEQVTGKGLEKLIEEQGLVASPKTPLGSAQFNIKRAEQEINKIIKENDLDSLLMNAGKNQLAEIRLHNEGLVRAVTRQILSEDIKAGKIKGLTLDDLGTSREPIDYFRKIYGEGALEQLDSLIPEFNRLSTEQEAAKLARGKFKFEPNEAREPGSISYEELEKNIKKPEPSKRGEVVNIVSEADKRKTIDELIDEYNVNIDRKLLMDEEGGTKIGYQEFQDIQKRNEEIAKALEEKGISPKIEEEVKSEGIVIPFRKKFTKPEPEEKAQGGIIGYAAGGGVEEKPLKDLVENYPKKYVGLIDKGIGKLNEMDEYISDYVRRQIEERLTDEQRKKFNLFMYGTKDASIADIIKESGDKMISSPSFNFEKRKEESMGGRIGYGKGDRVMSSIDKLLESLNKKLSKKKSMETVNPKTGEVTIPKKPIRKAEEPTGVTTMDQEPIAMVDDVAKQTKELTDDEMVSYIKQYKENGPTLEEFTQRVNQQTGLNFTPEQLEHAHRVKVAYPHSTPIVDSKGKFIGGGLYNPPLDVSLSDRETLTKSIVETRKSKGLSVPKEYQEKTTTPPVQEKAGEGRFTKQQVLEKIIQQTIDANPKDEYIQTTFPNFIKEIRNKPELASNENVWNTFTEGFPENKRLVVYGDDTVDFFTKGENLPEGMKQTQELADTYGLSLKEAMKIKQMEPEDQVMEIKKLQVMKQRTQNAIGGFIS